MTTHSALATTTETPGFAAAFTKWLRKNSAKKNLLRQMGFSDRMIESLQTPGFSEQQILRKQREIEELTGISVMDEFFREAKFKTFGITETDDPLPEITSYQGAMQSLAQLTLVLGKKEMAQYLGMQKEPARIDAWTSGKSKMVIRRIIKVLEVIYRYKKGLPQQVIERKPETRKDRKPASKKRIRGKKNLERRVSKKEETPLPPQAPPTPTPAPEPIVATKKVVEINPLVLQNILAGVMGTLDGDAQTLQSIIEEAGGKDLLVDGHRRHVVRIVRQLLTTFKLDQEELARLAGPESEGSENLSAVMQALANPRRNR